MISVNLKLGYKSNEAGKVRVSSWLVRDKLLILEAMLLLTMPWYRSHVRGVRYKSLLLQNLGI